MRRLASRLVAALALCCALSGVGMAQQIEVVTTCSLLTLPVNTSTASWHLYLDASGNLCVSGGGGGGGGVVTNAGTFAVQNTAATPAGTNSIGGVTTSPGARTLVTLAVKTVTAGGTAVTAIASGARTAGGWLQNPPSATVNLCINEIGTATGTTSAGDTTCIVPGQGYMVTPAAGAVSIISSDSAHPFSGYSLQ